MLSPVKIWRSQKKVRKLLGLEGKIISFTRVHVPPAGFVSQAPYIVVIARLDGGTGCVAQLVDFEDKQLKIGQKVITVLRKTRDPGTEGVIPYGIKFRPV
jgi:uncharacterized protein